MRFNPKARLDTGRVGDAGRGSGGGGRGGGMSLPGGVAGGGGVIGTIIVIVFIAIQVFSDNGAQTNGPATDSDRYAECQTGADANESSDCARRAVEVSLRSYWSGALPEQARTEFAPTEVVTFTDSVTTGGCGAASAATGPFYCPGDRVIYLDSTFFETVLEDQLGGTGGDFVEPYVLAHEYGHHIQNLLGTMSRVRSQQGADSDAVRLELQADCYAGMWTRGAATTTDESGTRIFESIDGADIDEAVSAAKTVGDDQIQKTTSGRVDREGWTHGSSEQRVRWFKVGYDGGSLQDCDTFAATSL
ncbi:neutral zinc metallopeptidase [Nocardioides plantarum]|uniref:Neutral zinc metallopeptidase n=1 Tax=Nocardioides plantarum TaxID=29299 RepID=A0ABV5K5V3_9ACTN|nr:neutral zinc metallopeptidase [Nocardioides plantarum]